MRQNSAGSFVVSLRMRESWLLFRSEIVLRTPFIDRILRLSMKNFASPFNRSTRCSAAAFLRSNRSISVFAFLASNSCERIYRAMLSTFWPKAFAVIKQGFRCGFEPDASRLGISPSFRESAPFPRYVLAATSNLTTVSSGDSPVENRAGPSADGDRDFLVVIHGPPILDLGKDAVDRRAPCRNANTSGCAERSMVSCSGTSEAAGPSHYTHAGQTRRYEVTVPAPTEFPCGLARWLPKSIWRGWHNGRRARLEFPGSAWILTAPWQLRSSAAKELALLDLPAATPPSPAYREA